MKTLHNIFHKNFFKNYFKIFVLSSFCLIVGIATTKIQENSNFISWLNTLSYIVAGLLPLGVFFINTSFPHNVKWLINQHFNRLELLKFFFFSQTLKTVFCILNYMILLTIVIVFGAEKNKIFSIISFDNLFSDYFVFFILSFAAAYLFYFVALFSANKVELQRSGVTKLGIKNKKKQWQIIFGFIACLLVMVNYTIPDIIKGYVACIIISFPCLIILNRTFKLYDDKKANIIAGVGSFSFTLPILLLFCLMRIEAHNVNIDYKLRARSVIYLNWMNSEFKEDEMLNFLEKVDANSYSGILNLFGDKVSLDKSLALVKDNYRARRFINFHTRKHSEEKIKKIVEHMSSLMTYMNLSFRFARYSDSFFMKQKVSENYIHELIKSKNPYKQLAAIYFAKKSLNKEELISLYNENVSFLKKEVINDRYVKRAIASEE